MTTGRRGSTPARGAGGKQATRSTVSSQKRGKAAKSIAAGVAGGHAAASPEQPIGPLYKRLPHGPHRLDRTEVVRNQRARIHGAMVEAVGRNGYAETSIKQVIALAGVSRRSFYEQFSNKQECFLATFDLIVRRELQNVRRAYLSADGGLEERAQAGFARLADVVNGDRAAAALVLLEAQAAGLPGAMRLRRAAAACEQMLAESFAQTAGAVSLPAPIVRAIVGGLHGAASEHLRRSAGASEADLARELTSWMLLFQTPAAETMSAQLSARAQQRLREIASACGNGQRAADASSARDERSRSLQAVLRVLAREDFRSISAPEIADEANVSVDVFCEMFPSKDECLVEALDAIGDDLLTIAADPALVSEDWPRAVRAVLERLLAYLASHPLQTRALAQEGFSAGRDARERIEELAGAIATLLTEGAPRRARGELVVTAVAGAIWHTMRCQVAAGRVELLAALGDHLSYVVLAPFLGAEQAALLLSEEPPRGRAGGGGAPSGSATDGSATSGSATDGGVSIAATLSADACSTAALPGR